MYCIFDVRSKYSLLNLLVKPSNENEHFKSIVITGTLLVGGHGNEKQ